MAWSNVKEKNNNNGGDRKKTAYVNLKEGTTTLRVIDEEPVSRWTHWLPQANAGKGLGVTCNGKGCVVCAEINKDKKAGAKSKYSSTKSHAINVINRETGTVEVLDKGNKIFQGLVDVMEAMGDLRNIDIMIKKTGSGFGNVTYSVLPKYPPTALSQAEKAMERFDLAELTKGFPNEELTMLMRGATIDEVVKSREDNVTEGEGLVPEPTQNIPTVNPNLSIDFTQGA